MASGTDKSIAAMQRGSPSPDQSEGGAVLAFNDATDYAIENCQRPVKSTLQRVRNTEFYAPGLIFSVEVDRSSPLASLFNAPVASVWLEDSPAFEVTDPLIRGAILRSTSVIP